MAAEPGSHLTLSQRLYLQRFMRPGEPHHVSSATYRITWTDSDGVLNTGHYGPSELGPIVPIVVRETTLALWRDLAANRRLADAVRQLSDADFNVLAATTTDHEPAEIFRIGIEATGRALAQHALIAHHTPHQTASTFAEAMRDSRMFATVAATWFWELQASTYRRGMIPAAMTIAGDGAIGYTVDTVNLLVAMKQQTIDDAQEVMRRATEEEGLTVAQAVQKYHTNLDLVSKQYALMDPDTPPRCLANMANTIDGSRVRILPGVADTFVRVFLRMLDIVDIRVADTADDSDRGPSTGEGEQRFHVPDMNCRHCRVTISAVLESLGVEVVDVNLVNRQVVARFGSIGQRDRAFAAVRDSGYTVIADGSR